MLESSFHNLDYANTKKQTHAEQHQQQNTKCSLSGTKLYLMTTAKPDEKDEDQEMRSINTSTLTISKQGVPSLWILVGCSEPSATVV